jgi:large subunit ribosomal protein L3
MKLSRPRKGSLQYYPRKRASKSIPRANWKTLSNTKFQGVLGILAYKAGMSTAVIRDATPHSMTLKKKIHVPVTILEVPPMKVFAVRFYRDNIALKDIIVSKDKELKKVLKLPNGIQDFEKSIPSNFSDIRLLVYSTPKNTSIKKTPDILEVGISSSDKLSFVKQLLNKEITLNDFMKKDLELVDVRGLTKGKGLQGPVKRFGITLKSHKSEKGVRNPGSLGPWHPARVTYYTPMAGQLGLFSRVHYNQKIITSGDISQKNINPSSGFKNYGNIKTSYLILKGSVQGPSKRAVLLTPAFRPTHKQTKLKYEFVEVKTI